MKTLHRLLVRQLKKNQVNIENPSEELISLAESISSSYEHYESSKNLIERAMEISNLELEQVNIKLIEESKTQKLLIESLKESIKDISIDGNEIENDDILQISQILKLEIQKRKAVEENLKEAQKLAEESLKSKELFLANMSHEIRTPLNAILGMVWLLSRTNLNSKQKEYKEVLKTSTENLLVIINNILDISKIESGKLITEKVDFNLDKLLAKLIKTVDFKAEQKSIELLLVKDPKIQTFFNGDSNKLNQILVNLVGNAIKFTSKGSVIISLKLKEVKPFSDIIEFSVKDSGLGISKSNLQNIFLSFSQEDASINRKYGGTGLGLTISKELVHALGGEIKVKSKKDKGSKFSFVIELLHSKPKKITKKTEVLFPKPKKDLNGCAVLIVEDDIHNRILLESILEDWNVTIGIAENGLEAIEKLKSESFDIVLMDMHMPQMDGLTATKEIRTTLKLDIPIIALTADVFQGEDKCFAVGMNNYISKPFSPNALYKLLEKYILL